MRAVGGPSYGIPIGATYVYCCVWPVAVTVSGVTYYIANKIFPHRWEEVSQVQPSRVGERKDEEDAAEKVL